jgi:hypothetical protein
LTLLLLLAGGAAAAWLYYQPYMAVDAYLTPPGIAELVSKPDPGGFFKDATRQYESFSEFSVTPSVATKDLQGYKVILTRSGLHWRVTNISFLKIFEKLSEFQNKAQPHSEGTDQKQR